MRCQNIRSSASEERLYNLIQERLKPDADKERIDSRIWDLFGEELCIMFTDLAGFSRNVAQFGIIHFLQTIYEAERLLIPIIGEHDGILLKDIGDSLLIIFKNVRKGILASIAMQQILKEYNKNRLEEEKVLLCVGLGFGKVLRIGDADVFGHEVNMASKLGEDIAGPWEILVTEAVREKAHGFRDISFEEFSADLLGAKKAYRLVYRL